MEYITKNAPDFSKFVWVNKKKCSKTPSEFDCTIGVYKTKGIERVNLTLRNGVNKKLSTTEYVMFGIDGDRLWFAQGDSRTGYKMSKSNHSDQITTSQSQVPEFLEWAHHHIGDYTLNRDSSSGLYFIDARRC